MQQAVVAHQRGDFDEAARLYKIVLRREPAHFDALHFAGLAEAQRGRADRAEKLIREALRINPNAADAHANLGQVLQTLGRLPEALACYDAALALRPRDANTLNGRGAVLVALKRPQEALENFEGALALDPRFAGALHNKGTALRALKRPADALAAFDQALALEPTAAALHVARGSALTELKQTAEAIAAFDRAIALEPQAAAAFYDRGVALVEMQRFEDALASFDRALAIAPRFAAAHSNRAKVLLELGRTDEAFASFESAIEADPAFLSALSDKGHAALAGGRFDLALDAFSRVAAGDDHFPYALGNLVYAHLYCCDWHGLGALIERVTDGVRAGQPTILPGHFLAITHSAEDQRRAAEIWARDMFPAPAAPAPQRRYAHERIRLAYVSADFHAHATAYLLAQMIERHDRTLLEVTGVSLGPDEPTDMRKRMREAFDHFIDARDMTNEQLAELLRTRETDIAVDLKGYTQGARMGLFPLRPANVQACYLGYPGTTALAGLDYIIADAIVIPEKQAPLYSERVVYLPDSYQVNDSGRRIAAETPSRADAGLPEHGFVFCCFNNNYKITPDVFTTWMRILAAVEGSVLWLLKPNATAAVNLKAAAQTAGIAPERLVFAGYRELPEHLARHRLADLFLDTLPYNAHTTASDALWAGLPVLTCAGQTFPARVAASLLHAVGLSELATGSLNDYEALAVRLARDPEMLTGIKAKLAANRSTCPLFDTDRFRQHIEQAYITMWERHERGELPESFTVPPLP
jgi:predicted O-linked N-acetylglucosamine transferase (SPINDLY family)